MKVFLIGLPGSGKTTVGHALEQITGWTFVDLDEHIEQTHGMSIAELMPRLGEERFRQVEHDTLIALAHSTHAIVACGGGTPCQPGLMSLMNATGLTVWLTTSEERIVARLCLPEHRRKRPQIATLSNDGIAAYVHRIVAQRTPHYAQAHLQFDATHIETAEETTNTARRLAQLITTHCKNNW